MNKKSKNIIHGKRKLFVLSVKSMILLFNTFSSLFAECSSSEYQRKRKSTKIKVMSFNIAHSSVWMVYKIESDTPEADIIGLQEVDRRRSGAILPTWLEPGGSFEHALCLWLQPR